MNHMPAGYYNANSLAAEARRRGVQVMPVDINTSQDKCYTEGENKIRLGLRLVSELRKEEIEAIEQARDKRPFCSLLDFCIRVILQRDKVENLILAGTFDSIHDHRRGLLWRLDETLAMAASYRAAAHAGLQQAIFYELPANVTTPMALDIADFTMWDQFLWTWRLTGVCAECHVFTHLRAYLERHNVLTAHEAQNANHGERVTVAGLNISPHRPPTKSGEPLLFTSIEDESGLLQAICIGEPLKHFTGLFLTEPAVVVRGRIEHKGKGTMLRIEQAKALSMSELAAQLPGITIQEEAAPQLYTLPTKVRVFGR